MLIRRQIRRQTKRQTGRQTRRHLDANPAARLKCQNYKKPTQRPTPIWPPIQTSFRRQSGGQIKMPELLETNLVVNLGVIRRQSVAD